ncbi:FAD-dependent oxidoreductase, partial [Ideonella dechloratans]
MASKLRPHAGIAGAGVLGRLLAWRLAHAGWRVSVVDPAPDALAPARGSLFHAPHAAGFTAAGMLSPLAELDQAEPDVAALGWRSLDLWQAIARRLPARADAPQGLVRRQDSRLLAHPSDLGAAQRVLARL